jgi:hypothetical protein
VAMSKTSTIISSVLASRKAEKKEIRRIDMDLMFRCSIIEKVSSECKTNHKGYDAHNYKVSWIEYAFSFVTSFHKFDLRLNTFALQFELVEFVFNVFFVLAV